MAEAHDLTPLCELAKKYETDKGGWHLRYGGGDSDTCHNYTPTYYRLLAPIRDSVTRVLEVGINAGGSLRMWRDFFPHATVWGMDVRPETMFSEDRIHTVIADAFSPSSLACALEAMGQPQFDFIVDDASHEFDHQWWTCNFLMPNLRRDGLYVIEDMCLDCQPEVLGAKIKPTYRWEAIDCGVGIGKAHCDPGCPKCHGFEGERLLVVRHR